eukprot:COSAG01_NODE_6093_length_3854_cov_7.192011_3_plen_75_part_00
MNLRSHSLDTRQAQTNRYDLKTGAFHCRLTISDQISGVRSHVAFSSILNGWPGTYMDPQGLPVFVFIRGPGGRQ